MTAQRVVVTGGSSGLGEAIVDNVLAEGGSAYVLDTHMPSARVPFTGTDVSSWDQVLAGMKAARDRLGGIDGLVTAAGIDRCGALADVDPDDWEMVVRVNLLGTVNAIRAALPDLVESHGRVVTVSSILALRPAGDASAYCASKAGVLGLTHALAAELKGKVGLTALVPGGMATSFFDGRDPQYQPAADAQLCAAADVARAVSMALTSPAGCELREIIIAPANEPGWP